LAKQFENVQRERDDVSNRLADLAAQKEQANVQQQSPEVLKLRGQVGMLRQTLSGISETNTPKSGIAKMMSDPAMREYIHTVQTKIIRERLPTAVRGIETGA